jgi:hypothetical protein
MSATRSARKSLAIRSEVLVPRLIAAGKAPPGFVILYQDQPTGRLYMVDDAGTRSQVTITHKATHQDGGADPLLDLDETASYGPQAQTTGLFISPGATTTGWPLTHRRTRRKTREVQASANGIFGIGHTDPSHFSGTLANANDADGSWVSYTDTTQMGHNSFATTLVRQAHKPFAEWLIKTGSDITNIRILIGLNSTTINNNDDPGGHFAGFRYSAIGGDAGWIALTRDGTTLSASSSLGSVAADTMYRLTLWYDNTGYRFSINGGASTQRTSNLPGSTQDLGYSMKMFVTGGANRTIKFSAMSLESN